MSPRLNPVRLLTLLAAAAAFLLATGDAGAALVTWVGGVDANWNTTTANWTGGATVYTDLVDNVTFDDTSTNLNTVSLTTTLNPVSVTVGAGRDFTFGGTGKLAGATGITKSGNGALTLSNSNTFTGTVNVNAGTVRLGNLNGLGATTSGTLVNNGGTLDLYGKDLPDAETVTVAAGGTVINTFDAIGQVDKLVLTGNATFGGSDRLEIRGTPSFGNYTLTVDHTGNGASAIYDAVRITNLPTHDLLNADVIQGTLAFHNSGLGTASGTITIADNPTATYVTTLQLMNSASSVTNVTKNLVFKGGKLDNYRAGFVINGSVTLDDLQTEVWVNGTSYQTGITMAVGITGDGGITKTGSGVLTLQGANTYSGNTIVSAGKVTLGSAASLANSPVIDVQGASAVFDVSAVTGGFTLANGQTLKGRGTVTGSVATANGSQIAPGASVGSLAINGSLALDGTLAAEYDGATIDLLTVAGNLDLNGSLFSFPQYGAALTEKSYVFLTYTGTRTGIAGGSAPAGYAVAYDDVGKTVSLTLVPEPSIFVLAILGLACVATLAGRRQ